MEKISIPWKTIKVTWNSSLLKKIKRGFPGGAVVGSLPASAGDTGSSPGLGGSHMPRGGWAREPQLLSLRVWSLCLLHLTVTAVIMTMKTVVWDRFF